jgi:hypothetical protein
MKRIIYLLLFIISAFAVSVQAQVRIGSNQSIDSLAILDLTLPTNVNKGLLLPIVTISDLEQPAPLTNRHQNAAPAQPVMTPGMVVFNDGQSNNIAPGAYAWMGHRWEVLAMNWFHMPSTVFETNPGTYTKQLWQVFANQFTPPASGNMPRSAGAPEKLYQIPDSTAFYYYVTEYDKNVFDKIAITAGGTMSYEAIGIARDTTVLNVIFVRKLLGITRP